MPEKIPLIKKGWLRAVIFFVVFIITEMLFQGIAGLAISRILNIELIAFASQIFLKENLSYLLLAQAFMTLGSIGVLWLFVKWVNKEKMASIGLSVAGRLKEILLGFLLGFGLIAVGFVILKSMGYLAVTDVVFEPVTITYYFLLCIVISIKEEFISRGYILNNLMSSMKKYWALAASALFFAVFHGMNPNLNLTGIVNIFIGGLFLGIAYIYTKNLWFPVALHTGWNFTQGPLLGFAVSGLKLEGVVRQELNGNELLTGGEFGFEGSILATVLVIVFAFLIHLYFRKRTNI